MLRTTPVLRQLGRATCQSSSRTTALVSRSSDQVHQRRQAHAISNPTLANIEKRWEGMPPQEQADLWMALRDRMKVDWNDLTVQEKKAGESTKVFVYAAIGISTGVAIWMLTHHFAGPPPRTMTKEWQEATNEYLKESNVEPITGVSSEGYVGPGMVQSKPASK